MFIPFPEQVIMDTEHQQNGTKRKPNIEQLLPADKRHKPMEMENGHDEVQGGIKSVQIWVYPDIPHSFFTQNQKPDISRFFYEDPNVMRK